VEAIVNKAIDRYVDIISFQLVNTAYADFRATRILPPTVRSATVANLLKLPVSQALTFKTFATLKAATTAATSTLSEEENTLSADTEGLPIIGTVPNFRYTNTYNLGPLFTIPVLTNTQKLNYLRTILINFVNDGQVKHLCESAQINDGHYQPSQTLRDLWATFFQTQASFQLRASDYEGLNTTALGEVIIMQTVSAYTARCNCSTLFEPPQVSPGMTTSQQQEAQAEWEQNLPLKDRLGSQVYNAQCPNFAWLFLRQNFFNDFQLARLANPVRAFNPAPVVNKAPVNINVAKVNIGRI
jgi:hypothetical protein